MTFRKGKRRDGQTRLATTYRLCQGDKELATVQRLGGEGDEDAPWFWYGDGINTARKPATLAECKAEVLAHFKAKAREGK